MSRFILLTLSIPICFLFTCLLFFSFYEPPLLLGSDGLKSEKKEIYGIDGVKIAFTHSYPQKRMKAKKSLVIFISDFQLDRNWNSSAFSFQSGYFLGKTLTSFGIEVIRYDHRGVGKSIYHSETKYNFELKAQDLRYIHAYAHQKKSDNLIFLAHGNNACLLLLYSLKRWKLSHDGMILLSCGGEGDGIELWEDKLFFNMARRGVDDKIITQAKGEWESMKKDQKGKRIMKTYFSPDMKAFGVATKFFFSSAWESFRKELRNKKFLAMLVKQIEQKKPILHITAQYDEERSPKHKKETLQFANQMKKNNSFNRLYRFVKIKNCDHFFKEQKTIPTGFGLVLARYNPFRTLHPQLTQELVRFVKTL